MRGIKWNIMRGDFNIELCKIMGAVRQILKRGDHVPERHVFKQAYYVNYNNILHSSIFYSSTSLMKIGD